MIYLDSAATSLEKPPAVSQASAYAMGHCASPGRGGHQPAQNAANVIFSCREECCALFQVENPENVVFTSSATHSLNIAIKSLVKSGDTVAVSPWEHNAVTRPLYAMEQVRVITPQAPLFQPEACVKAFSRCLTSQVDVAIFTHMSNVFGYILPIEELAALCRCRGIPFIIDASQSAGCLPIRQEELGADFIAMPGHKGLLGPQGTGILLCNSRHIRPLMEGGTGTASRCKHMPLELPDRLEAGTHNICGIAGLRAGIRTLRQRGISVIHHHETQLIQRMIQGISPFARVFAAKNPAHQGGVLSFQLKGWDCEELAFALSQRNFAVRAGLHCAPLAHQSAGTLEEGTVRASVSPYTSPRDVDLFIRTLCYLSKNPSISSDSSNTSSCHNS